MNNKYSSKEFAKLLGISKSTLFDKERRKLLPRAKRERRGAVSYRYYSGDDIPTYRKLLHLTPLIRSRKIQLFLNFSRESGKSFLSANHVYYASTLGIRCLAIDLVPDGDLTSYLVHNPVEFDFTIGDLLLSNIPLSSAKVAINPHLDLIPADSRIIPAIFELNAGNAKEFRLKKFISKVLNNYDLIVIDSDSHPDILSLNAIIACNEIIIPVSIRKNDINNIDLTLNIIKQISEDYSGTLLEKIYILINEVDNDTQHIDTMSEIVSQKYSKYLLKSRIRFDPRILQAKKNSISVFQIAPNAKAAKDIKTLTEELLAI
jgi:chromosome partitioning protein